MSSHQDALPAMPIPSDSFWARLNATPALDTLRGRLTGSLDFRRIVAAADLPAPLPALIYKTVRKTRLWRVERVDVARELTAHFRDGLNAGGTAEQLRKSFGDPRQAARLIRRAKLRSRPLFWRVWRRAKQAIALLLALLIASYFVLWIRLVTARPTLAHNYAEELNAPAKLVPEKDRAWPLYREAILSMTPEPQIKPPPGRGLTDEERYFSVDSAKVGGQRWPLVLAWLNANRRPLELLREAGRRRRLGFVYGDPKDLACAGRLGMGLWSLTPDDSSALFVISPPSVSPSRVFARMLAADAHRAIASNDGATFAADIEAIASLADHVRDDLPLLVTDLTSCSVFYEALGSIDEMLANEPSVLMDASLVELAHPISAYAGGGTIRARLSGERIAFLDLCQRMYTDDGNGDGRLALGWFVFFDQSAADTPRWIDGPPVAAIVPCRRTMTDMAERMFDEMEKESRPPLWEWAPSEVGRKVARWNKSPIDRIRYGPFINFGLFFDRGYTFAGERITQQRDATLVALALELYHRRNGSWPKALDELVPDFLPAVPPDRFTGGPMLYRIRDGRPLLYSAGPDRRDDGGRPVEDENDIHYYPPPGAATGKDATPPDGDWILWPPQKEKTP